MGYRPLHAGFAFLPFSFGIVIGAGLASNLVARIDPRYLAGVGTLLAAFSLFMFSRLSADDSPGAVVAALANGSTAGVDVNYWTSILPVGGHDVDRHGPDVRAADPDRRPPRAGGATRASAPAC